MKAWHIILLMIGLVASFFTGYHIRRTDAKNAQVKRDTVIDTLRTVLPIPSFEIELSEVEIPYPIIVKEKGQDRVDTIYVPVPVTQKEYVSENYRAWVSGYNAALDSIYVFPKTVYVTQKIPARRWGLGVSAGYGVGRSGLSPYVGVGIYYRLW